MELDCAPQMFVGTAQCLAPQPYSIHINLKGRMPESDDEHNIVLKWEDWRC